MNPKEHWESKASELKNGRKFEEAVMMTDKAKEIKRTEQGKEFWYNKAVHYCDIGDYEQARDSLLKDVEINNNTYETLFLLGKILFELKLYEESLEYLNKASEYHDSKILKTKNKVNLMKNVRKFEEAVIYSDKLNQENILDDKYWFCKGMIYQKLNKFKDAILSYNLALEKTSEDSKILYELAKSELCAGNKEMALEILEKVCVMDPINKKKLKLDKDFETISKEKRFRMIVDSLV